MNVLKKIQKRIRAISDLCKYGTDFGFLRLEACSFCQLDCVKCPSKHTGGRQFIGNGYLTLEHFKQLIESNPCIKEVELSNFGEIFLNPEIDGIIEYAYKKGVLLDSKNGSNLNTIKESTMENLCKYKFNYLALSIDGASQEIYSQYRRKGDFDTVIENIKKINEYKKKYQTDFPKLSWCFIVFGHNQHELAKAKEMAVSLGMKFDAKLNSQPDYSPIRDEGDVVKELGFLSIKDYKQKQGKSYYSSFCRQLWHEPQVNWDGKLLGCCINKWTDFGNIFDTSLQQCLKSKKYKLTRKVVLGKIPPTESIPCYQCPIYHDMKKTGVFAANIPGIPARIIRVLLGL